MNANKLPRTEKAAPAKLTGDCCQSRDPEGTVTIRRPPGEVTGVLVTGATGYVGSRLVPALLARNYQVHALVRSSDSPTARRLAKTGASLLVGDLVDGAPGLPANVQAVVHLASAMFPGLDRRVIAGSQKRVAARVRCDCHRRRGRSVVSKLASLPRDCTCALSSISTPQRWRPCAAEIATSTARGRSLGFPLATAPPTELWSPTTQRPANRRKSRPMPFHPINPKETRNAKHNTSHRSPNVTTRRTRTEHLERHRAHRA